MSNLSNINSITLRGKRIEIFENTTLNKTSNQDTKKKTILSKYLIEQLINEQSKFSVVNNFLSPVESWTISTSNGKFTDEYPINDKIDLIFMDSNTHVFENITTDSSIKSFSRSNITSSDDLVVVKINTNYDYSHVCIPKLVNLIDKVDTTLNKTYIVKAVVLGKTDLTVIAPTIEYFTTSNFTESSSIGDELINIPFLKPDTDETIKTLNVFSKSFILFNSQDIDFNISLDVENMCDVSCINSSKHLKLSLDHCRELLPVGPAFKEISLSPEIEHLSDYEISTNRVDLFVFKNVDIIIPNGFVSKDSIVDESLIQSQLFNSLTILDNSYMNIIKTTSLEKPINRYTYWNLEDYKMELFYRHKMSVSNDVLFKRNNELYDQTYKLKFEEIKNGSGDVIAYRYKQNVTSNLPIYFFASLMYDEDYKPYDIYETDEIGNATVITIKGTKVFKVEVSEKFRELQFKFVDNSNTECDYIIRYSMPHLNTPVLNSKGHGILFLNDGTTFIEAGMDQNGVSEFLPSAIIETNSITQCETVCDTIYLGIKYFNSELIDDSTAIFRYGKYILTDNSPCFNTVYVQNQCLSSSVKESEKINIVKKILFGDSGVNVNIKFYTDDNLSTKFTTRSINVVHQHTVFGRKLIVFNN